MNFAGKFDAKGAADGSGSHSLTYVQTDSALQHGSANAVTIPDAHLLFSGDYARSGADLIVSDHLHRVVVPDYFHGAKRPMLVSPEGAPLDPKVIEALTGHVQYAQAAGTAVAPKVVGNVVKMTGSASVVRNGVTITLNNGDVVYQNDVVQTGSGSTLGLVLIDGTTFNMTANARLMLNDLVYDATSTSNSSLFTLVQGAASFVAGQVAKSGDMKVATPVATLGIRGTAVILDISATDGKVSISVIDQQDNAVHAVQVFDRNGTLIGTVTSNGSTLTLTPTATFEVLAQQTNKTPAQIAQEFNAFQQVLNTYDIGKALVPSTPAPTDGKRGDATPQSTTKFAGSTIAPVDSTAIKLDQQIGGNNGGPNSTAITGTPVVVAISAGEIPVGTKPTGPAATDPIFTVTVNVPATPVPFVVTPSAISQISSAPGDHFGPVMSADGNVVYDPDGVIYYYDRASNTTTTVATPGNGFTYSAPTISSDGRYILYQGTNGTDSFVFIYGTDASDTAHYHKSIQLVSGTSPAISGNGSTILVEHGGSSIGIYDLLGNAKGEITPASIGATGTLWKPAISADGHVIAFWSSNLAAPGGAGQLFTYDLSTGAVTAIASTATGAGTSAASFSADGRFAVYQSTASDGHSEIYLYDLIAKHVVFSTADASGSSYNPVISPDGHFIIFASDAKLTSNDTNSVADTYVVDVTDPANPVYKLVSVLADGTQGNAASNGGAAISAGGLYVAFASNASSFAADDDGGAGDIFVVDGTSGRSAIVQKSANSPADITATGVITLTGGSAGVTISVSDSTGRFTAAFDSDGNIRWNFKEQKSDFASLQYGQVVEQRFVVTLTTDSGSTTTPVKVSVVGADHPVVTPVNVAPVATIVALSKGTEDAPYTITAAALLKGVADIDGPSLSITSVTIKSGGGAIVDNHDGTWTYTPASGFNGPVVFDYTASDGSLTASSTANLNIDSANDAPTDVLLTNVSVAENTPAGTIVGTLSAIDPDLGDTATFALIDNPGGAFALDGNRLVVAGALDFETTSSYQIKVRVTDSGGLSIDKVITIGVIDVPGINLTGDAGNNTLTGTIEPDSLSGLGGNDVLQGLRGNDFLDGGAGRDFAVYTDAAAAITVNLALGSVQDSADVLNHTTFDLARIGTDTLRSIEYVRGSNFNDTFVATGFGTTSTNASSITSGSVNNGFEGMGGDDTITGNGGTQVIYRNALGAVTVDLRAGTAQGTVPNDAAGIGRDTFTGVNSVRGSEHNDTLLGSDTFNKTDVFYGGAGNDFIDGRGGYDLVVYSSPIGDTVTARIQVDLAAGTVIGDASVGTDTLRGVELIRGTNFNDIYTAAGFSGSSTNAASPGTGSFNDFEGMGGNDAITGNNNTRVSYTQATAAVRVDLAAGSARDKADFDNGTTLDVAGVGIDTITGGVNQVRGSDFDDTLLGSGNTGNFQVENFLGGKGNDSIDGRQGYDRAIYSQAADDPITGGIEVDLAAGTVTGDPSVGTDTLRSVEFIRGTNFDDTYTAAGFSGTSINASSFGNTFNEFEGMDGDDRVTGNGNTRVAYYNATAAVAVDLGAGSRDKADFENGTLADAANVGVDTFVSGVNQVAGSQFGDSLRGTNNVPGTTEFFEGRGGDDAIDGGGGFDQAQYYIDQSTQSGVAIDMAAGIVIGDGVGRDTLRGIESVTGTRFDDSYGAIGFGDPGHLDPAANNVGSFGTFNEFQGYGGDDSIVGNGNTRIAYYGAAAAVTVDLAQGSAGGGFFTGYARDSADFEAGTTIDAANVGIDRIVGVNQVAGSQFSDTISGDANANTLDGQGGDDTLDGRGGDDSLFGRAGRDTFVYSTGRDIIWDFNRAEGDKIDLTGVPGIHSLADLQAVASTTGANTDITFSPGNTLRIFNIVSTDLIADDFVFAPNHAPTVSAAVTGGGLTGSGVKTVNLLDFASDADSGAVLHVDVMSLRWSDGSHPVGEFPAGFTLSPDGNSLLVDTNAGAYSGMLQGSTFASHFTYKVVDQYGAFAQQTATVNITDVNDAPVFAGQAAGSTFVANGGAVAIATNVSASDVDSVNYNGGLLTATVTAGGHPGDTLSIASSQYIRLTGTAVEFDSDGDGSFAQFVTIGTLTNNINSLTIALNNNASDAAVAALTQAIRFQNTTPNPVDENRTVTFTLNDGGGTANGGHDFAQFNATVAVTTPVNAAPVVTANTSDNHVLTAADGEIIGRPAYQGVLTPNLGISGEENVTVEFWINDSGEPLSMVFGFFEYDLLIGDGGFGNRNIGFNTGQGDHYYVQRNDLEGQWHHVAAVFNNGDVHQSKLYIDGVLQTLTQAGGPANNLAFLTDTPHIGGWQISTQYSLAGSIDDVSIWRGARSAADIAADMNGSVTGPHPNLVAAYTFESVANGTGGVTDSSGNGHHATFSTLTTANVSTDPTLHGANYATFNGHSAASTADSAVATTQTDDVTMEGWVNWNGTGPANQMLFYNGSTSTAGFGVFGFPDGNGHLVFDVGSGGVGSSGVNLGSIAANEWHHVALTRSVSGTFDFYIDGQLQQSWSQGVKPITASDDGNPNNVDRTMIGGHPEYLNAHGFNGSIGEVRIWNEAHNATEINQYKNVSLTGDEANLAGYWRLNDAAGTTADDATAGNHDLSLSGGAGFGTDSASGWPQTAVATAEDTSVVFSIANHNSISVSDADGDVLTVMLTVEHGAVTLASLNGITITNGANATSTVEFHGSIFDINAALEGLSYQPALNYNGSDALVVSVSDGALSDTKTIDLLINPDNNAPIAGDDNVAVRADYLAIASTLISNDNDPDGDSFAISGAKHNGESASYNDDGIYTIEGQYGTLYLFATAHGSVNLGEFVNFPVNAGDYIYDIGQDAAGNAIGGSAIYDLQPGNHLTDTFTYTIRDSFGAVSQPATITVTFDPSYIDLDVRTSAGYDTTTLWSDLNNGTLTEIDATHLTFENNGKTIVVDAKGLEWTGSIDDEDVVLIGGLIKGFHVSDDTLGPLLDVVRYSIPAQTFDEAVHNFNPGALDAVFAEYGYDSTGSIGADQLSGGNLVDTIDTGGGADIVHAGNGNDVITIRDNAAWTIDGGDGIDTIKLSGAFDLVGRPAGQTATSIEIFDLNTTDVNTIRIKPEGLFNANADHVLRILGNVHDSVLLSSVYPAHPNGEWAIAVLDTSFTGIGDAATAGVFFDKYEYRDGGTPIATLYVQRGVFVDMHDDAPRIGGDLAVIGVKGRGVIVRTEDLLAVDPDSYPSELSYTVTAQSHGSLYSSSTGQLAFGSTFTQQDVNDGLISFVADPNDYVGAGSFSVVLSDGSHTTALATTVGTTAVDAHVQMGLVPYDFVADDPATKMGAGEVQSAHTQYAFTVINEDANRDFYVTGSSLSYAGDTPNGGTIDTIVISDHTTHQVLASLHLNVSAADFYNAVVARAEGNNTLYAALTGNWSTYIEGSELANTFVGASANDIFVGGGGGDTFDGGFGFDRAGYGHVAGGINVQLAAGTVSGNGFTDHLNHIELVTGTEQADLFNAGSTMGNQFGFSATSTNHGSTVEFNTDGTFNEFEGRGGDDTIAGNGNTRISYYHATSGVTVNLATGRAQDSADLANGTTIDAAGIGIDTILNQGDATTASSVTRVRGSFFDDTIIGVDHPAGTTLTLEGLGGNDQIMGGVGFDRSSYAGAYLGTGVNINLGLGTASGGADTGFDTLRSIEGISGTDFNDTYDAGTFTAANAGAPSTNNGDTQNSSDDPTPSNFNEFDGNGGNDTVTGNNNTRVAFYNATGGVVATLTAGGAGSAYGNESIGHDTYVSGVTRIRGTEFNDIITGNSSGNRLEGRGGNDVLDGGTGNDTLTGDAGSDIFVYRPSYGRDVIADFSRAEGDRIDLRGTGITATSSMTFTQGTYDSDTGGFVTGSGPDTKITSSSGFGSTSTHMIFVLGVTSLQGADFIFNNRVSVAVQTPDGYDLSTLYSSLAAGGGTSVNDANHIFILDIVRGVTIELVGNNIYNTSSQSATTNAVSEINILDTTDSTYLQILSDRPQPTQDHVLVNTKGWNFSALSLFVEISNYNQSNHTDSSGLDLIFNAARYNVVGASGVVTTDDKLHDTGDVFFGGNQNDVFKGLAGSDTVDYSHAPSPTSDTVGIIINLASPSSSTGAALNDFYVSIENLRGTGFSDTLIGDGNNNILEGGLGNDRIDGGGGNNTVSYEHATPGSGNVGVTVDLNPQSGTESQDTIRAGIDTLLNIQNVRGSAGNDTLTGDTHDNVLTGLGGNDVFVFKPAHTIGGSGHDIIADFAPGHDRISLDYPAFDANAGSGPSSFATWLQAHAMEAGGDVSIDLNFNGMSAGHDTILLKNIALANLHASDFFISNILVA